MFSRLKSPGLRLTVLMILSLTIVWLSLSPSPPDIEINFLQWDKARHALAYAVLTIVAGGFFLVWSPARRCAWEWALVYALGFGGGLEILQKLAGTGRSCEWGDLLANLLGVSFIYLLTHCYRLLRHP